MKRVCLLGILSVMVVGILYGCSGARNTVASEEIAAPSILNIRLVNEEKEELSRNDAGWIDLPSECKIEVGYEGNITRADFFIVPTGTESDKELIGTVEAKDSFELGNSEKNVIFCWKVPDSVMGNVVVILYNDQNCTSSEAYFFIKVYKE